MILREGDDDEEDETIPVPDSLNDSQLSLLTDKNFDYSIQSDPSIHLTSDSEAEEEVEEEPEAVFDVREHLVKTGSNKGKMEKKVGLTIGNHTFKRQRKMGTTYSLVMGVTELVIISRLWLELKMRNLGSITSSELRRTRIIFAGFLHFNKLSKGQGIKCVKWS